jgi:hypothetical protein
MELTVPQLFAMYGESQAENKLLRARLAQAEAALSEKEKADKPEKPPEKKP